MVDSAISSSVIGSLQNISKQTSSYKKAAIHSVTINNPGRKPPVAGIKRHHSGNLIDFLCRPERIAMGLDNRA